MLENLHVFSHMVTASVGGDDATPEYEIPSWHTYDTASMVRTEVNLSLIHPRVVHYPVACHHRFLTQMVAFFC